MKRRIFEFDVVRVIAVLMLPFIHIMEFWGDMYGYSDILSLQTTSTFNVVSEILCIFAAPTFMICMGINMLNTRHDTAKDFFKRGIFLLLLELVFNVIRYEIPGFISLFFANTAEGKQLVLDTMLLGIFNSDILALAGLAFLCFALFKKLKLNNLTIVFISLFLFALDFTLNKTLVMATIDSNINGVVSNILGNLIYVNKNSTFPVAEWLVFISFGYVFGSLIKKIGMKNENKLFLCLGVSSLAIFISCVTYCLVTQNDLIESLCQAASCVSMTPLCLIAEISASTLFISIVYFICKLFKLNNNQKACEWFKHFSNNTNAFYLMQWIIVGVVMMVSAATMYQSKILPIWATLLCYLIIVLISYFTSDFINKLTKEFAKLVHLN